MRHLQGAVLSDDTLQALLTQFDLNRNGSFDIVSAAASLLERKFRRSSQTSDGEEVWDARSCGSEFSAGNGLDGGGYAAPTALRRAHLVESKLHLSKLCARRRAVITRAG